MNTGTLIFLLMLIGAVAYYLGKELDNSNSWSESAMDDAVWRDEEE